jgi:hypothetical protein
MGDDVTTFDEQFPVERDANGLPGALAAIDRPGRPTFDAPDPGELSGRHDHDLIADRELTGFDATRHDPAVVEFVDRLYRQS